MALTVHNGSKDQDWTAGERLLEDVFDLIQRRLPELAVDDPCGLRSPASCRRSDRAVGVRPQPW